MLCRAKYAAHKIMQPLVYMQKRMQTQGLQSLDLIHTYQVNQLQCTLKCFLDRNGKTDSYAEQDNRHKVVAGSVQTWAAILTVLGWSGSL